MMHLIATTQAKAMTVTFISHQRPATVEQVNTEQLPNNVLKQ